MDNLRFNLSKYITDHNFLFSYIKVYLIDNNLLKAEFVKKLGISLSYFCYLEQKKQPLENKMADLIIKKMKLNKLKPARVKEYETTLFRVYNMIFYKNSNNIATEQENILAYKAENNILSPIFELMWLVTKVVFNSYSVLENEKYYHRIFKRLKKYKFLFVEEIEVLYAIALCRFELVKNIDLTKLDDLCYKYPIASPLIHHFIATLFYFDGEFNKALIYEEKVELEYKRIYNPIRQSDTICVKVCIYNEIAEYNLAYETCYPLISYMIFGGSSYTNLKVLKKNFYNTLLLMKKYDELQLYLSMLSKFDNVDIIYQILLLGHYNNSMELIKLQELYKDDDYISELISFAINYKKMTKASYNQFINNKNAEQLFRKIIRQVINK